MECDLIAWCLEQVEDQIQDEQQVLEWQTQLQAVIRDMIKTGDIAVRQTSADPSMPEDRVLAISEWVQRLPTILAIGHETKKAISEWEGTRRWERSGILRVV